MYICPVCKNKNQKKFEKILDDSRELTCTNKNKNKKINLKIICLKCLEKDWEEEFLNNVFTQFYLHF